MLDALGELNQIRHEQIGDPETLARIEQYEMAFRMQSSVPDLTDLSSETDSTYELYGEDARKPGTFANTCLLARRLVERDVRFVQVYHRGWDVHGLLPKCCHPVQRRRSGLLRPRPGPEAARPARRHAGHLGRRIRPHDLLPGQADGKDLRPRPPSALLHAVDGRRRRQGRH